MDSFIQDCLDHLREVAKTTPSVFATEEELAYFAAVVPKPEPKKSLPPPPPKPQIFAKAPAPLPKEEPPPQPVVREESFRLREEPAQKQPAFEIRGLIQKTFPDLALRETIPDDSLAKKMAKLWEETYLSTPVVVIAFGEVGPGFEFLKQMTQAIDKLLVPAQLIEGSLLEKEKSWELLLNSPTLKTVIISPWASWKSTSLARYYRQNGSSGEQFMGEKNLLILEPSLIYLKHPDNKRKLWQLLNTQLSS